MSLTVNIEALKEVSEALKAYTNVVDVQSGGTPITQLADKVEEHRKLLEQHKSTQHLAEKFESLPTHIKDNTAVLNAVVEAINNIVQIVEQHEAKAKALVDGA